MNPQSQPQPVSVNQVMQLPIAQQSRYWVPPDKVRSFMAHASEDQKAKFENGIRDLFAKIESIPDGDSNKILFAKKLTKVSFEMKSEFQKRRTQMGMATSGANVPPNGGQVNPQNLNENQLLQARIIQMVQNHVDSFPFHAPVQLPVGSPEAEKFITEAKARYSRALQSFEHSKIKIKRLQDIKHDRQTLDSAPGQAPTLEEIDERLGSATDDYEKAKAFIDNFRIQQAKLKTSHDAAKKAVPQGAASSPATTQAQAGNGIGATAKAEYPGNAQQPPQINTSVAETTNGQHISQPRSAEPTSATQNGAPKPLSHQAAMAKAANSYTGVAQPITTGNTANTGFHQGSAVAQPTSVNVGNPQLSGARLPIPKQLPPTQNKPVTMSAPRPSYSGGASVSATGIMGQPAVFSQPSYNLGNESERVLSKKKLQELIRQVCGQSDGIGGEAFSAEVEEAMYEAADDFVDDVINKACQAAKTRGSSTLELRDVQMILERTYNMRIPGYTSDEIRVVRKIAPASGWQVKMAALQASKISKDKGDT
ncbi:MAG: hypothetical protein M1814_001302 [Vezdaea aestivalis]|nr:MAG: hypothetical protein M1814_001302 [Vezdaea aestivalis]